MNEEELLKKNEEETENIIPDSGDTPAPGDSVPELNNNPEISEPEINNDEPELKSDTVMTDEQKSVEKLFSQKDLDDIVGRVRMETRNKTHDDTVNELLGLLGADSVDSLKDMVGNGQRFPMLEEEMKVSKKTADDRIAELEKNLGNVTSELALFKSDINPDRYEDVKLILSGKGLDITADNIKTEVATHPEWINKKIDNVFVKDESLKEPVSKISRLGNGKSEPVNSEELEKNAAMDYFDI